MSYTARRQALSLETRTHTHTLFLPCPSSFDTAGGRCDLSHMPGGVGEKQTPRHLHNPPAKRTKQPPESTSRAPVEYSYPQHVPGRYRGKQDPYKARRGSETRWHTPTAPHPPPTGAGGNDSSPKPGNKAKPNAHSAAWLSPGTHTTYQPAPKPTTSHPSAGEDSTPSTTAKSSAEHATEAKATEHNQTFNSNNKPQKTLSHGEKPANLHREHPLHRRARPRTA